MSKATSISSTCMPIFPTTIGGAGQNVVPLVFFTPERTVTSIDVQLVAVKIEFKAQHGG